MTTPPPLILITHRIRFRGGRTALFLMVSLICGITTSLDRPASIRSFVIFARRRVPRIGNLSTLDRQPEGCWSQPKVWGGATFGRFGAAPQNFELLDYRGIRE